jgi:hypothetical protein
LTEPLRAVGRALARPLVIAALASPLATLPSCVAALELDGYGDAIDALCKCDSVVPQFEGRCVEVLGARLDAASPGTREGWLASYVERCHGECANAFGCYQSPGTCSVVSCTTAEECCEWDPDTRCFEGVCGRCRAAGAGCSEDADCCSGTCTGTCS